MIKDITEIAGPDPLLYSQLLPLSETFFPLGFPLEISTNDDRILAAARASFGGFVQRSDAKPIHIDLAVSAEDGVTPQGTAFRGRGHLFSIVCDAFNFAHCDLEQGFAFGWVTSNTAQHSDWLRYRFLEAIAYSCLVQQRFTPLHAAAVARGGRGLLLCAPGGTGKTTLAYYCARQGWSYLSDDAVYLHAESGKLMVLGKPYSIRFVAGAANLFDELQQFPVVYDPNGELRIDASTSALPGLSLAEACEPHSLVFLDRSNAVPPGLTRIVAEDAAVRLMADIPQYRESVSRRHRAELKLLAERGAWLLRYGDYREALPYLNSLL